MDAVKPVVREDQIPCIHAKNLPVNVHGFHCSTHVAFWMLRLLRYLPADSIDMKTLREDEDLVETIGNCKNFKYQVQHDMKEFKAEIRKFIVRLAFVTALSEERKMTYKIIKDKEESVDNMSCQE
eukprot:5546167-Ditylum_brightwellii.AAC.1